MARKAWPVVVALAGVGVLVMVVACLALLPAWGAGYGWRMTQTPAPWTGGWPGMTQAPAPWAGVGGWGMMGMMAIWPIFLLVIGVLGVAGIVWAVQLSSRGGSQSVGMRPASEAPLEILRRRYAGGEITKEQFDEMRRTLDQG